MEYKGEDDITGVPLVICSPEHLGRGVTFTQIDDCTVELIVHYPATKWDIEMLEQAIRDICTALGTDCFIKEETEEYTLADLKELMQQQKKMCAHLVKEDLEPGLTVFGCFYPIQLEDSFLKRIDEAPIGQVLNLYAEYLHEKQKEDRYYSWPHLFETEDGYIARYPLFYNVPSIFPLEKGLPFGVDQSKKDQIIRWTVWLWDNEGKEILEEVPLDQFVQMLDLGQAHAFDAAHCYITLNRYILDKVKEYRVQEADGICSIGCVILTNWAENPLKFSM